MVQGRITIRKGWKCLTLFILVLAIDLPWESSPDAKIVEADLETMVHEAQLIVVGTVIGTGATGEMFRDESNIAEWKWWKAVIRIEHMLKSVVTNQEINVYYLGGLSTEARFKAGDISIFFLSSEGDKYQVVRGYGGKVDIQEQRANPYAITGEESPQPLNRFLAKIRVLVGPTK